ncbi:MAG: TonB-dependent receptor [Opitutaceae bacterium]|nr:TonB-dependent receptor [Opitutaceae bacterium]
MAAVSALAAALMPAAAFAQVAPAAPPTAARPDPNAKKPAPAVVPTQGGAAQEVPVQLSPFEVVSTNQGYFASNTMSGTRLNSKIEDLGQSITVMTKEQMADFAMLDINDVFDHLASTEGTNSFSDFVVDRTGAVTDNVSLDPNNANRVRGIGAANIAFNNIATTGRVPVDPLWMDSLEVSRGPNANIFGLGNSSGTVNQVPATANLTRNFTKLEFRGDSYEGWRTSIDVNRMLLRNRLSVRASLAHQHTGFVRKPAGEDARRISLQAKARPFRNTTIALSWYRYNNASRRPNYTTPRDFITSWFDAGKPAWNPVTRLITLNGVTYGQGMVAGSTTPITTLPAYFAAADARSIFRIGTGNEAPYWTAPTVNTNATTPLLNGVGNTVRFVQTAAVNAYGANQPLFATSAALADKSIYNWEDINLQAANKAWDNVNTYLAQIDQIILNTPRHTLAAQATFMREDAKRLENLPLGPASVNGIIGQIYADPNIVNLDGSANPYYGRPYLKTTEPFLRDRPLLWETTRAQAAYRLDFSQDKGWTRWIGTQQLLGYYEYKNQESRHYAWRHTATSLSLPWVKALYDAGIPLASRTTSGTQYQIAPGNVGRLFEQYYVGSTPGGGVEYGPSNFPEGASVPFVWGNTGAFNYAPSKVEFTPSPDGAGGLGAQELVIKTVGGVLQNTFLDGKLVTTFGQRQDKVFSHNAPPATLTPDLRSYDYAASDRWLPGWRMAQGKTKTSSAVVRPFRDLRYVNRLVNEGSGLGKVAAEVVRSLSLTYNRSDNFIPQGPAVDLFLRSLPNQTGKTKDVGLWLSLFDGKLSVRYNSFKTDQINVRNGDIATIAQRVLRADGLNAADAWALQDRATDWVRQLNPSFTEDQIKAEVAKTMGLSQDTIDRMESAIASGTLTATQDVVSKGDELEIYYNPSRAWTISASATKTESINQNAGNTIEEWIALRMPVWTTVEDPRFPDPARPGRNLLWRNILGTAYTSFGYNATNSAATNYTTFVEGPLAVYRQLEGRPRPQMRKYSAKFSTRYNLSGLTEHRLLKNVTVGGSLRWSDKGAIGFYGVQSLPATITALNPNRPIYSAAETYVDVFMGYHMRLFSDRVRARLQLNVRNVQENGGGLQPTGAFPDGTPLSYRIVDPRQFILTASFDL